MEVMIISSWWSILGDTVLIRDVLRFIHLLRFLGTSAAFLRLLEVTAVGSYAVLLES